jgi:hypothetical protein
MSRSVVSLLAMALLWPSLAGAAGGTSFADARKQPAPKLAARALAQLAEQLVAVRRPESEPMTSLEFSTRPKSAGFPGLCSAKIVLVQMRYGQPDPGPRAPARADDLSLREVYSVAGATDPIPGGWNEPYGRWLEARCGELGNGLGFFSASTSAAAWRAMRVMTQLVPGPDGRAASGVAVACANAKGECDVRAMLGRLSAPALANAEETPCNAEAPDGQSCMTLTFAIDRTAGGGAIVKLAAVLRRPEPYPVEIVRASISGVRETAD